MALKWWVGSLSLPKKIYRQNKIPVPSFFFPPMKPFSALNKEDGNCQAGYIWRDISGGKKSKRGGVSNMGREKWKSGYEKI